MTVLLITVYRLIIVDDDIPADIALHIRGIAGPPVEMITRNDDRLIEIAITGKLMLMTVSGLTTTVRWPQGR